MGKECKECVRNDVGCDTIQKMQRAITDLKQVSLCQKKYFIIGVILVAGFVVISIAFWWNLLHQGISVEKTSPDELKNVAKLFNSQFANMLTLFGVLTTIFGFIVPLINFYFQRLTLKDEREIISREIDINLEISRTQVRDTNQKFLDYKGEIQKTFEKLEMKGEKDINESRVLLKALNEESEKRLNELKQLIEKTEKKLNDQEKDNYANFGYFMQQLGLASNNDLDKMIYFANAVEYFSFYPESDNCITRTLSCLEDILKVIKETKNLVIKNGLSEDIISTFKYKIEKNRSAFSKNIKVQRLTKEIILWFDTMKSPVAKTKE